MTVTHPPMHRATGPCIDILVLIWFKLSNCSKLSNCPLHWKHLASAFFTLHMPWFHPSCTSLSFLCDGITLPMHWHTSFLRDFRHSRAIKTPSLRDLHHSLLIKRHSWWINSFPCQFDYPVCNWILLLIFVWIAVIIMAHWWNSDIRFSDNGIATTEERHTWKRVHCKATYSIAILSDMEWRQSGSA